MVPHFRIVNGILGQCLDNLLFMEKRFFTVVFMLFLSASVFITPSRAQNSLKGYEWLEGIWFGVSGDEFAQIKISRNYYQIVGNRWGEETDIEKQERIPIDIKVRYEYWSEESYLSLADRTPLVGIDKNSHTLVIPMGEFESMHLDGVDIDPAALKEGQAQGLGWLYGVWSTESFDRISMTSSISYLVITPTYYKLGENGDWIEYVIKTEKDEEGKVFYCLVDKEDLADYSGSWKEISGFYCPEDEQVVYMFGGVRGWDDEFARLLSF